MVMVYGLVVIYRNIICYFYIGKTTTITMGVWGVFETGTAFSKDAALALNWLAPTFEKSLLLRRPDLYIIRAGSVYE